MRATSKLPVVLPLVGLEGIVLRASCHASRAVGVCAMEAVAWLAGEPHSDKPECACPVIGAFMRNWNDALPDDETRTRLLRPLLPLLVGSRSTPAIELARSWMAMDWLAREHAPAWLDLSDGLKAHAVVLRGLSPITDATSAAAALPSLDAAWAAARATARATARDAARAALAPTVAALQASAADLVRRMVALGVAV